MMKSKKIIGLTLIGMTLASSMLPTFAEYSPKKVICPIKPISIAQDSVRGPHLNIVINEKGLNPQDTKAYMKENGITMIPLRVISETLGYKVKWNGKSRTIEVMRGAQFITIKLGEDQYAFGKMSPVSLGAMSEIKDGRTYVPLNFVTDILRLEVMRDETGAIYIKDKNSYVEKERLHTDGKISNVQKIDGNTRIVIEGMKKGQGHDRIVLNITEDTIIQDPIDHKEISLEDLKEGDMIRGFYGSDLTRSLPPVGNAEKIEVLKHTAVLDGEITDIRIDDKNSSVLVGSMTDGVMLIINDETKIVTKDHQELSINDLKEGMEITAYHNLAMTMSIPGMTGAKKIIVNK